MDEAPYIIWTPGDLDLILGEWGSPYGALYYWERAANGTLVAQTGASNPFAGIDVFIRSKPAVADWDGDGQRIIFTLSYHT